MYRPQAPPLKQKNTPIQGLIQRIAVLNVAPLHFYGDVRLSNNQGHLRWTPSNRIPAASTFGSSHLEECLIYSSGIWTLLAPPYLVVLVKGPLYMAASINWGSFKGSYRAPLKGI